LNCTERSTRNSVLRKESLYVEIILSQKEAAICVCLCICIYIYIFFIGLPSRYCNSLALHTYLNTNLTIERKEAEPFVPNSLSLNSSPFIKCLPLPYSQKPSIFSVLSYMNSFHIFKTSYLRSTLILFSVYGYLSSIFPSCFLNKVLKTILFVSHAFFCPSEYPRRPRVSTLFVYHQDSVMFIPALSNTGPFNQ